MAILVHIFRRVCISAGASLLCPRKRAVFLLCGRYQNWGPFDPAGRAWVDHLLLLLYANRSPGDLVGR